MNTRLITGLIFWLSTILYCNIYSNSISPELLSPEDQKMLAELDNEINTFVNSLPPDQQQQFWKDVEELTETMSKMKPDELENFVQGVFSGDITELPTEKPSKPEIPQPTIPTQSTQPIEVRDTPKLAEPVQLPAIKKMIESLETVIDQIETFLRKTQIIPKIESKVVRWAQQGRIIGWQSGTTWNRFKAQIDELVQKLYKAKDRDSKTKDYHYITAVIANKTLVSNIEKIGNALKQWVPHVEAPALGQSKLTQKAQSAIEQVSTILHEALFTMHLPKELDAIFSGSTSLATQKQLEEQKSRGTMKGDRLPLVPRPATGGVSSGGFQTAEYTPPLTLDTSRTPMRPYTTPFEQKPISRAEEKAQLSQSSKQPTQPAKGPGKETNADGKQKKSPTSEKKPSVAQDTVAEGYLDEIINNIEKTGEALQSVNVKDLKNHLTNGKDDVITDIAVIHVPQAIKFADKATDKIKALTRRTGRLSDVEQKKQYRESFKQAPNKKKIDDVQKINAEIRDIKDNFSKIQKSIHPDKQYAYFGGINSDQASSKIKQQIPNPSSIFELERALEKLMEAVKNLEKTK